MRALPVTTAGRWLERKAVGWRRLTESSFISLASALEIELTESALMTNAEEAAGVLKQLRKCSFIRDLTTSPMDESIVRAIVRLLLDPDSLPREQAPHESGPGPGYTCEVAHLFVPAASGRSRCRACAQLIKRGELRFGECLPNLFGEGEMTLWFHPLCAAYKRPQPLLEALAATPAGVPDRESLERAALGSLAHRRIPRIDGAERSPSGQARCRSCREPIVRGSWRIRIVFYEEGRFSPGGYVHLTCRKDYFETDEVLDQILHFSPALSDSERDELIRAAGTERTDPSPQRR